MKMILFITPPYRSGIPELAGRWIPLNLLYLAGAAREAGLEAALHDAMALEDGYPEIGERLTACRPAYVATSAMTATVNDALQVLELVKRSCPGTVTILGGIHPSRMYREILASRCAVDFVVVGEGEETLRELVTVLERGGDPAAVQGVAFRSKDGIVVTPRRAPVEHLDALACAWDLVDWPQYRYFIIPDSRLGAVCTSREGAAGAGGWRGRQPQQVADEIAGLYRRYGVNVFLVTDRSPAFDAARWERFLDLLIGKEIPVHLIMEASASQLVRDREIIWKYRRAGVVHVAVGLGDPEGEAVQLLRQGTVPEQAREALELLHGHGIVSEVSFLLGFPDETAESVGKTLKGAQRLNPDLANFYPVTPWPCSKKYRDLEPYLKERDYSKYNLIDAVLEPEGMTLGEVEAAISECFRKFYMAKALQVLTERDPFKRGYLLRATKLMMGSSFVAKRLFSLVDK